MFIKSIESKDAPKAIGPYSVATKLGDFVYISGQLPIDPKTMEFAGNSIEEQTKQCMKNLEAVLAEIGLELRHILKTTIYVKDLNDFAKLNEVYGSFFEEAYPARSCVEVSRLPKDALVEIEAFAIDTLIYEQQMMSQDQGCSGCGSGCDECNDGC